jgi:cytochrome c6
MARINRIGALILAVAIWFLSPALQASAADGEQLFNNHCAGCHPHGGNIIRRGRTLKLRALEQRQLNNPDAIARIAREGIGQMGGYAEVLGSNGDQLVAQWIWDQAQKAWVQG